MKRIHTVLFIVILTSAPAWATAIVSTQTEAAQNITTEHLLFTITATGEQVYTFQPSLSSLNGAAANIQFRLEHDLGNNTIVTKQEDVVCKAKWAATDTQFGCRVMGPIALKNGEKALFYCLSSNASDTSVTYVVDVVDCLAIPTGAATAASIGTIPALDGAAQTVGAALGKIADDNSGATYDSTTDSLHSVYTKINGLNNATQLIQRGEPPALTGIALTTDVTTSQGVVTGAITTAQGVITGAITTASSKGEAATAATAINSHTDTAVTAASLTLDDVWTIELSNASLGESWIINIDGTPGEAMNYVVLASVVQNNLNANYGGTSFAVTGDAGGPYRVVCTAPTAVLSAGTCTGDLTLDVEQIQTAGACTGQELLDAIYPKSTSQEVTDATDPLLTTDAFNAAAQSLNDYLAAADFATGADVTAAVSTVGGYITAIPAAIYNYLVADATTAGSFGKLWHDLYH
jgi:hypothetical protein